MEPLERRLSFDASSAGVAAIPLEFDHVANRVAKRVDLGPAAAIGWIAGAHEMSDGSILVVYNVPTNDWHHFSSSNFALAKILPSGLPDPQFGDAGIVRWVADRSFDLPFFANAPDGSVYLAAHVSEVGVDLDYDGPLTPDLDPHVDIWHFGVDGKMDLAWGDAGVTHVDLNDLLISPDARSTSGWPVSFTRQSDGTLVVESIEYDCNVLTPDRGAIRGSVTVAADGTIVEGSAKLLATGQAVGPLDDVLEPVPWVDFNLRDNEDALLRLAERSGDPYTALDPGFDDDFATTADGALHDMRALTGGINDPTIIGEATYAPDHSLRRRDAWIFAPDPTVPKQPDGDGFSYEYMTYFLRRDGSLIGVEPSNDERHIFIYDTSLVPAVAPTTTTTTTTVTETKSILATHHAKPAAPTTGPEIEVPIPQSAPAATTTAVPRVRVADSILFDAPRRNTIGELDNLLGEF